MPYCKLSIYIYSNTYILTLYISKLIRHSRACGSYHDFFDREFSLTRNLPNQGFLVVKLKSSPRKIHGRHHDLVERYYVLFIVNTIHPDLPLSLFTTIFVRVGNTTGATCRTYNCLPCRCTGGHLSFVAGFVLLHL